MKDYYKLLEVNDTASPEVIQAAYKVLAKKYHPDCASSGDKALREARMKEINNAKETLLNPVEREKYDTLLRQERARLHQEMIEYKVEKHNKKNQPKTKEKRREYKPADTPSDAVLGAFSGFFGLFKNPQQNKGIIIACLCLFVLAFLQIILCFNYFFGAGIASNNKNDYTIIPYTTTVDDIYEELGKPKTSTSAYLEYGEHAKILINKNEKVIGWIDNYQELKIDRYDKMPKTEDISIGMYKDDIIEKWGYPDTYSESIFVYNNLIINFESNKVIKVEKQ